MKISTAINFIILLVIVALLGLFVYINQREALTVDGRIYLSGLHSPVDVYFDKPGVPYIQARSQEDLIFAQGFITASERLFHMDMLRRIANGEMAAIFGAHCLEVDKLSRIVGFRRLAEAEYQNLSSPTKEWLKNYCDGINAYIAQGRSKLPLECILLGYQPNAWRPQDTLAILKYLQYASDECWQINVLQSNIKEKAGAQIARQLLGQWPGPRSTYVFGASNGFKSKCPDLNKIANVLPPPAELSWGSNGWVVGNLLSQSGGSLLACDKHGLFTFPDLFFACSLHCPLVHVAGLTVPGVPGILIGRNDHIAWAPIGLKGRWQELTREQFSEKYPDRYLANQTWVKSQEFEEEISQRFAGNVIEKILVTRHGPVLVKDEQIAAVLNWYGLNPSNNIVESIWPLNSAKNFSEFQLALQKYKGSPQVFLYTDTAFGVKQKIAGYQSRQLSSALSEDEPSDYIVANMQSADSAAKLASLGALSNNWAALRCAGFLKYFQRSKHALGLDDVITLQSDMKAPLSEAMVNALRNALETTKNIDQYQQKAFAALASWDGQLKGNSFCACLYESLLTEITKEAIQEKIGIALTYDYINKWPRWGEFAGQILEKNPAQFLPIGQRDFPSFVINAFSQSLRNLRLSFDRQQMPGILSGCQWQNLHKLDVLANINQFVPSIVLNIFGLFLPGSIGFGGDQDCVAGCNYLLKEKSSHFYCRSGPVARIIIDMADNDKFYQAMPFGQSTHLLSGDRISQTNSELDLWRNMKFHAIAFSKKEMDILATHHLSLTNDNETK